MAELINRTDSLNQGREKLNKAIGQAEESLSTSKNADIKATKALANSEYTQNQLNTIIIEGDSSVEAAQARVDTLGSTHDTLKGRLDYEHSKLSAEKATIFLSSTEPSSNDENTYWYEDLGESPININADNLLVANAYTSNTEPNDIKDLWFKTGGSK